MKRPSKLSVSMIVGDNIRRIRNIDDITQEELAYLAGLNKTHMHRIERGSLSIRLVTLERLAGALRVSMATLLRGCP